MTTGRINQVTIVPPGLAIQRLAAPEELVTDRYTNPIARVRGTVSAVRAGPVSLKPPSAFPLYKFPRAPVHHTRRPKKKDGGGVYEPQEETITRKRQRSCLRSRYREGVSRC